MRSAQLTTSGPLVSTLTDIFLPGDACENFGPLHVRQGESLDSPHIGGLPAGSIMQILTVNGRRAYVRCQTPGARVEGWISLWSADGEQLVQKRVREGSFATEPSSIPVEPSFGGSVASVSPVGRQP